MIDDAVAPAAIGRLIQPMLNKEAPRRRPRAAERGEAAARRWLRRALAHPAGPGRAVDIAIRVGLVDAHSLDAEAAGFGVHVELAAPMHERRTMSVVVRRESGLTELLHHDLIAAQRRGVEIDRHVCACELAAGERRACKRGCAAINCIEARFCLLLADVDLGARVDAPHVPTGRSKKIAARCALAWHTVARLSVTYARDMQSTQRLPKITRQQAR